MCAEIADNSFICADCMEVLREIPDKKFDLCLTDPPYGLEWKYTIMFGKKCPQTLAVDKMNEWDKRPSLEIFNLIKKISQHQIIWRGNYFADLLGAFSQPIIWDKKTGNNYYADGELAWTSIKGTMRIFRHQWCGAFKDSERGEQNVHPTQKPVALFIWCLEKYSKSGDLIIDPFCGSGTTAIACHKTGRRFVCIDKEPEYIRIAQQRYKNLIAQTELLPLGALGVTAHNGR